jgi:hypothetical protein
VRRLKKSKQEANSLALVPYNQPALEVQVLSTVRDHLISFKEKTKKRTLTVDITDGPDNKKARQIKREVVRNKQRHNKKKEQTIKAKVPKNTEGFELDVEVMPGTERVLLTIESVEAAPAQSSSFVSMAQGVIQYAWDHKEVIFGGVVTAATGIAYVAPDTQIGKAAQYIVDTVKKPSTESIE